jgi:hypothetical protein
VEPTDTDAHPRADAARQVVTALYQAHSLGLVRLAVIMLGDRGAAEDAVQDAFLGLYRRWDDLSDPDSALGEWFRVDSFNATLSWLADGRTLVFSDEWAVRTLDTPGQGQDLISDSELVWSPGSDSGNPAGYHLSCEGDPLVIDNGATMVCGAEGMPTPARHLTSECSDMWDNAMGFVDYSTAPGQLTRTLYIDQTTCTGEVTADIYWASPSGGPLIVRLDSAPEENPAGPQWNEVGVLANGRISPLSLPLAGGVPMLGATAW